MSLLLPANCVWVSKTEHAGYDTFKEKSALGLSESISAPKPFFLVRDLFKHAGLDSMHYGTAEWNPLGGIIKPGDKVLLKPNWVLDENQLPGGGIDCLLTHTKVIEAVLHYVVKAQPGEVIIGDAPLQYCDFENLRKQCDLDDLVTRFKRLGYNVQIRDFRLTKMRNLFGERIRTDPEPDKYCLFDLGEKSWLTPITKEETEFRVTNYSPDILKMHHQHGTHRYLIAHDTIDADVVINLPKLKTHKKAGVTGALKNMVGINGFKEYLPHHRKGGSDAGGDCYEGRSRLKRLAEESLDKANRGQSTFSRILYTRLAGLALRFNNTFLGGDQNLEGAWYGNDTVWRMCLDLQKILHYGNSNGTLSLQPQRKVITITDAIIAGDGDGPLAPGPVPLGAMTLGSSVAALEWVHCLLMRIDPKKIPLVSNAFAETEHPLTNFSPSDIEVYLDGKKLQNTEDIKRFSRRFSPPEGWRGHCEAVD